MTLALVVACKDSFYLMVDTRTQDIKMGTTSDNTQKVFHSNKHKLGVCIAGDAMLPDPTDPKDSQKSISVSHIMDEFFKELDARDIPSVKADIKTVDDFFISIQKFIKQNFGGKYVVQFQNHVSVFLAGIINNETVVGSYLGDKGKAWDTFNYSSNYSNKLCAFSNYQILVDNYSKNSVSDPQCPFKGNQIEKQNQLFSDSTCRQYIFDQIYDGTRQAVLLQHPDSIGEYFHYIKIGQTAADFKDIKYKIDGQDLKPVNTNQGDYFPQYIITRTEAEFDAAVAVLQQPVFQP